MTGHGFEYRCAENTFSDVISVHRTTANASLSNQARAGTKSGGGGGEQEQDSVVAAAAKRACP